MKIDINNYEAFFLDFVEGRLNDSSTLDMLAFLRNHPELKKELENFTDVRLHPEETLIEKSFLKKMDFSSPSVNPKNFDDYCIAYYEKILSNDETEKLFNYLKISPQKMTDFQDYGEVILKADKNIIFEGKPFLKKRPKAAIRTIVLRWTAVAAGIVLAVSVFYKPVNEIRITPKNSIAVIKPSIEQKTPEIEKTAEVKLPSQPYIAKHKTVKASPKNDEIKIEEKEEFNYLNPVQLASVESDKIERPEFIISENKTLTPSAENEDLELFVYAEKMIRKNILKENDQNKPKKKITLWDIATITLKGYNKISEKDIILKRKTDENGKLTAIAVETENGKYGFDTKN